MNEISGTCKIPRLVRKIMGSVVTDASAFMSTNDVVSERSALLAENIR
jgi:hypothetical protein